MIGTALQETLVHGRTTASVGNTPPARPAAPHGIYRCRDLPGRGNPHDRWCAIAVFGDGDWERFVSAIGRPTWTQEQRFASFEGRLAAAPQLDRLVETWTRERTSESVMDALQAAGIAAGIVANAADLCERDPHLEARAYWTRLEDPEGRHLVLDGVVPRLSQNPGFVRAAAPLLGENADDVLGELLGMTSGHIDRLRGGGVIL
jgi:crotonobetainyl-CoA:carnitine CoA-transferase CaiB-like acyl-CoA transferase